MTGASLGLGVGVGLIVLGFAWLLRPMRLLPGNRRVAATWAVQVVLSLAGSVLLAVGRTKWSLVCAAVVLGIGAWAAWAVREAIWEVLADRGRGDRSI